MTVRFAEPGDEDALFDLLMALNLENNTFGDELSEERIRKYIRLGTEKNGGLHGVIDGAKELAGSIGVIFDRYWYAKNYMLSQIWLFVRPAYRRLGYEKELIDWAKDKKTKLETGAGHPLPLVNSVITENRLLAKLRLWQRLSGAQMIGGIFLIR